MVVGRDAELADVERFLDAAGEGFAALALEGEAGIGKTTVWWEARRRAQERGARVLWCRPSAAEAKFSFAAVADLLAGVDEGALAMLPAPQRDAMAVALVRAAPTGRAPVARAVAAGFLSLVRAIAAERALVLAVDDWQWLDRPSRGVLEFTARRLESERVGLLCSFRSPPAGPLIGGAVSEERLRRVAIGSLSLAALGRIVAVRLGRSLPRPLLVRIAQASAGNPFYALEVARLVIERGVEHVPSSELPVPDDLRALTVARIRRLPPAAREALLMAAVLSAPDSRTVDVRALAPAEEAGIVTVGRGGRVDFAHPLFASAVYGSVSVVRRRGLHRQAAAALASDPEQRARHLALGSERPDPGVAARLDEAATLAAWRGAPDAAAGLAELAAEQTPVEDAGDRGGRLLNAARFHFDAGDLARAETLARQVVEQSPADSIRARALQLSAQLQGRRSNFTEAAALAAGALEAAGGDQRLRAGIELDIAYCCASLGNFPGAEPHARAAVELAEACGDAGLLGDALAVQTMAEFLCGRGLADARLTRALELEDPLRAGSFVMRPRYIYGLLQLWTGELAGSVETLGALRDEVVERGQEGVAPLLFLYLVWACLWRGDFDRASRLAEESREAGALLEDPTASAIGLAADALVHAYDGHDELARVEAQEALAIFTRLDWRAGVIWPLWALGLVELADGNPSRVHELLGPLADQLLAMGAGDPVLGVFLPEEIEALIALGELDQAQSYLDPFEGRARELDRAWAVAVAERCRGALDGARGEREAAFAAFERALAAHERTAMPFERARTLLLAGQAYRRFKQRRRARQALEEALEVFERVGAPRWAAKARTELARIGRPGAGGDQLTQTELRVAELAASGLSNQQVAERAFVSVKTVEANLTRVYRKLGVRSRTGLANALSASERPPRI
jgi:DNA-binding CsgD family transcriptional regulator